MDQPSHIVTLDQWAEWGKAHAPSPLDRPDWSDLDALIEAAQPRLQEDSKALRELLERSRGQLNITDPLLCDLGVHRWLDRETSYSDWLAWVLEQLHDPNAVRTVLRVPDGEFASLCTGDYIVDREVPLDEGYDGCTGQIDLLICFERALLGVEVKTEDEQYDKQKGYKHSLERLGGISGRRVQCVLVANCEVPDDKRFDFILQSWEDLSIALRHAIVEDIKSQTWGLIPMNAISWRSYAPLHTPFSKQEALPNESAPWE